MMARQKIDDLLPFFMRVHHRMQLNNHALHITFW